MKFIDNIDEKTYNEFCQNNPDYHFLQTIAWGNANKNGRNKKVFYVGLIDENEKLLCATLLIKTELPLKLCYFYAPRGFVMNFNNTELLNAFTKELKNFLKKHNAIYLRVNPGIEYQDIDEDGNKIQDGNNHYDIFNNIINAGYHHNGFNKLYESMEPRYTFRIDLKDDFNTIEQRMSKTFLKTVKKSYEYDLKIYESNDITSFINLVKKVAAKDDFKSYSNTYYEAFYKAFKEQNAVKIFEASLNPKELYIKFTNELNLNIEKNNIKEHPDTINKIQKLKNDLKELEEFKEIDNKIIGSLICVYTKYNAWTLYIGNDSLAMKSNAVNRLYYESIKDAKENNYNFIDLFGTVGDPKTKYKNLAGIFEFKRKMGGRYIEFIGDFDLINKRIIYYTRPLISKIYRKIKK